MLRHALVAALAFASALFAQEPPAESAADKAAEKAEAQKQVHEALSGWAKMELAEKTAAIGKATDVGGPAAAHALAEKLHDKEPLVRKALADALGKLKDEKTVSALTRALEVDADEKDGDLDAFLAICKALGEIGDAKAIGPLVHGVLGGNRRDKNWQKRGDARIQALGKIRDKESIDQLLDLWVRGTTGGGRSLRASAPKNPHEGRIVQSLQQLTGEKMTEQKEWHDWWKKQRAHFEFPAAKDSAAKDSGQKGQKPPKK